MRLLRKILAPISLVYALVVYVRNRMYDLGLFASKSYATPILCVGNLSVGGTGKTPMVELLITLLQDRYKVAVLSRGYRRKSKGFVLGQASSTVADLGDEPYQLHIKFDRVQVAVDADRQNAIDILERDVKPDVIILDDAFQHRKVQPGYAIVLTAFDSLYTNDWYLPTGNLRDSRAEANRADMLIVTKNPAESTKEDHLKIEKALRPKPGQKVLFSYLKYGTELQGRGVMNDISDLKKEPITLVTGIAKPDPLLHFLKENDITFEHLAFKDHHNFNAEELELLKTKSRVLTTEKDYMRLKDDINCNYISVEHAFFRAGHQLLRSEIETFMSRYS